MKRVLIVDDLYEDIRSMEILLENEGYDVTSVMSGKEALDRVNTEVFDVVLLDIRLPDVSGTEVLQLIKQRSSSTKVAVVSIVPEGEVDTGLSDAYIQKPFKLEHFSSAVENLVQGGGL